MMKRITCSRNHKFTEDNIYITPDGRRNCKACRRIRENGNKVHPWKKTYCSVWSRIHNKNSSYFKRELCFKMSLSDFKELWFRDKAFLMKRPSIDRINGYLGYIKNNCRYIELKDNLLRPKCYEKVFNHAKTK